MIKFLKSWMLPISMLGGIIFNGWIHYIAFLSPYLIFLMLYITYTRINLKDLRITKFHIALILVQIIGSWLAYACFYFINPLVATGVFLCVFICTATSAPVITGMLGGSVPRLLSYSLLSIFSFALLAPVFLPIINAYHKMEFVDSFVKILTQIIPLLLGPLLVSYITKRFLPNIHNKISEHQSIAFYLWAVALFIVMGNSVSFVMNQSSTELVPLLELIFGALIVCCLQFYIGRKVGKKYGDPVAGAQGLGQKNTNLAIWIALTYLNPLTSVAPGAYVAWQNIINSTQLYFKNKKSKVKV